MHSSSGSDSSEPSSLSISRPMRLRDSIVSLSSCSRVANRGFGSTLVPFRAAASMESRSWRRRRILARRLRYEKRRLESRSFSEEASVVSNADLRVEAADAISPAEVL